MEATVQTQGLPAPSGAPSAPASTETPATVLPQAMPGQQVAPLSTSPVNAEAAASETAQIAAAQEAAPVVEEAAAVVPALNVPITPVSVTGNDKFDQVGKMLNDKGVEAVDILTNAAEGALSLADKAAMVDALGADLANMAISQMEGEVTRLQEEGAAKAQKQKEYVDKALGGEGQWEALQAFALSPESGYTPEDQAALNDMLAEGGVKGQWAIDAVVAQYTKSQGFSKQPTLISGDGPTQVGFTPLTRADYRIQMRDAQQKFGDGSKEVVALQQQRSLSISKGF